jgi:predicted GIY-YIG superfamily endonuclease
MWFCYILRNKNQQYRHITYNGSTNNPIRRLRQHNEEISGGAVATHGKGQSWEIYALLSGFENHVNALSCEWRIKHPSGKPGKRDAKYRGVNGRIMSLNEVLVLDKWTGKCTINNKDCIYKLYLAEDVEKYLDKTLVPSNIEVIVVPKILPEHMDLVSATYREEIRNSTVEPVESSTPDTNII